MLHCSVGRHKPRPPNARTGPSARCDHAPAGHPLHLRCRRQPDERHRSAQLQDPLRVRQPQPADGRHRCPRHGDWRRPASICGQVRACPQLATLASGRPTQDLQNERCTSDTRQSLSSEPSVAIGTEVRSANAVTGPHDGIEIHLWFFLAIFRPACRIGIERFDNSRHTFCDAPRTSGKTKMEP